MGVEKIIREKGVKICRSIGIDLRVFECYERLKIMRAENIIG